MGFSSCYSCGSALAEGRFCPSCGIEQPASTGKPAAADPFVGRNIADRYEVVKLIGEGGMGRVYRAVQRSLDRAVALKFIHPHLLTSEEIIARFMSEAQTASRLNHPNVVSIFDFGRTPAAEGGDLFLVMELLGGRDLAGLIDDGVALAPSRIAGILEQTLAALSEAHENGIVHCDVKPENILLERRRDGGDHVKVIDFGIAKLDVGKRLTRIGEICGTPEYMSPEQAQGQKVTPAADLYAVGVILFLLLTGRFPFEGANVTETLRLQIDAPRPDPRLVAPERRIRSGLAEVCIKAISRDPADRYPTAEALAQAIVRGASMRPWSARDRMMFSSMPSPAMGTSIPNELTLPPEDLERPTQPVSRPAGPADEGPTTAGFNRAADVEWARRVLSSSQMLGAAFHGRPGTGRTRMLDEVASALAQDGAKVVRVSPVPAPWSEVGYGGLRQIIAKLSAIAADDPLLRQGVVTSDRAAAEGLRIVFGTDGAAALVASRASARTLAAAALGWAVRTAVEQAGGANVLLALDDADQMDGASQLALSDLLWAERVPGFSIVVASENPVEPALVERVAVRTVTGLTRAEAAQASGLPETAFARAHDIEPLYAEQLARWIADNGTATPPTRLIDLVEARLRPLPPAQRRVLQAVALAGGGSFGSLRAILAHPSDLDEALRPLAAAGYLVVDSGSVRLAHAVFGRVVLGLAPAGAIADLHAAAADALIEVDGPTEVRAFHAVRGKPDFEAFMLIEESARLRTMRGDEEGAANALRSGIGAARELFRRGEAESATSAIAVFAAKLAPPLLALDRPDEAQSALENALSLLDRDDVAGALLLEQLAAVAEYRGNEAEANAIRGAARALAESHDRPELLERLNRAAARTPSGKRPRLSSKPPFAPESRRFASGPVSRDDDELGTFGRAG